MVAAVEHGTGGIDYIAGAVEEENTCHDGLGRRPPWDCHGGLQLVVREIYVCEQHGDPAFLYMCACCHQIA